MAEAVPGVAVEPYYLESIVPISTVAHPAAPDQPMPAVDTLSLYLLDLMALHGYRVVSGVRVELPEPENVPYPKGWTVVRLVVDVQEFDVDVDPADATLPDCACGHPFDRHDGVKSMTHDACAGVTGFCGCASYRPA